MHTTLISATELMALLASGEPSMVFDCTFDLMNPAAGEEHYRKAHIPGAVYASLDTALSDHGMVDADGSHHPHPDAASGGRHPLPGREKFAMWLSSVGFSNEMQAVVYDRNGANYCGRLWWMLKWAGHDAAALLDGGLPAWDAAGGAVTQRAEPARFQSNFQLGQPLRRLAATEGGGARTGHARPIADRCARSAALSRRSGAAGPGGRPHPWRVEPAVFAEHRRRWQVQAPNATQGGVRTAALRARSVNCGPPLR